jgi:hypothetical protein
MSHELCSPIWAISCHNGGRRTRLLNVSCEPWGRQPRTPCFFDIALGAATPWRHHWLNSIEPTTRTTWRRRERAPSCWDWTSLFCTGSHCTRGPRRFPSICALSQPLPHLTARWGPCIPGYSGTRPAVSLGRRGSQLHTCCWGVDMPRRQQKRNLLVSTTRDDRHTAYAVGASVGSRANGVTNGVTGGPS